MKGQQIRERLQAVVLSVRRVHPDMYLENVFDFVKYGEWKLAVEVLCDNLYEDKRYIPQDTFSDLIAVGKVLSVDSRYWKDINVEQASPESNVKQA
ncbi:hypothetical protein THIOM_004747 [Candidatus Thiomargarita nelsonii]|uniref:Uncharacterized protein n=1 Tax=Candidatus Thiomargarita nelsonii TaxID=1003181 RepID=A0A176RV60_9GAMM|nr:hypothetical protein THIOM_004747 [Candidatus Thiomargarita nelsonii]